MKFNAMHHSINYYYTEMGDYSVEIIPVENCTVAKVNNKTFVLPYGTVDYENLLKINKHNPNELVEMLKRVVGGVGTSKYGVDTAEVIDELKKATFDLSDEELLSQTLQGLLNDSPNHDISVSEYHKLIDDILEAGNLNIIDDELIGWLKSLGKTINPLLSGYLFPAFTELMKQLEQSGLLQDIKDPAVTMKRYRESKGMN